MAARKGSGKAPAGKKAGAGKPRLGTVVGGAAEAPAATYSPRLVDKTTGKRLTADELKLADEGYQLARQNAVKYLHTRRQAIFSVARHYHLDADDLQQESFEVLLTCLRDFNPVFQKAGGEVVSVQFNTFFGNRLEGKALEMRNRDPEYQARQAHMADMSDADREQFRKDPPLLVQHLDQETAVQEHLRGEVAAAQRARQTNVMLKIAQDSFIEKKLNDLIAAERDEKRRAALMHVKVGGVASFEEIAYHFGVTDSRASQILNELMDAFYVQRLLDGDLKSIAYDFRKLGLQEKRANRLLEQAVKAAPAPRAAEIANIFGAEYPELRSVVAALPKPAAEVEAPEGEDGVPPVPALPAQLTPEEDIQFPLQGLEWRDITTLTTLSLQFRPPLAVEPAQLPHIRQLTAGAPEGWPPLLITPEGAVIDGERRIHAAAARGVDRLLCQVRTAADSRSAQILRICLNSRTHPLDKLELYFAIGALLTLGLSQGKIAEMLGTSRPNVIVYAKVREKASARLRQLFEDGFVQITNASSAVDLPEKAQDEIADFIRQHGASWGRGPQFTELYEAAAHGQVGHLAPAASPVGSGGAGGMAPGGAPLPVSVPVAAPIPAQSLSGAEIAPQVANALKRRQESLETALRDAEIWARQREATIAQQAAQIHELKQNFEGMKRELEAHELLSQADEATMAGYLKDIRHFYAVEERLVSATHQLEKAATQLRSIPINHRQVIELEKLLERIISAHTTLRVALVKKPGSGA